MQKQPRLTVKQIIYRHTHDALDPLVLSSLLTDQENCNLPVQKRGAGRAVITLEPSTELVKKRDPESLNRGAAPRTRLPPASPDR